MRVFTMSEEEAEVNIGEDIYVPTEEDVDPNAEEEMQMGKEESLRDPWFDDHTEEEIPSGL